MKLLLFGKVLIHYPADLEGLWINYTVENLLNDRDKEDIRRGFSTRIFNSRRIYWMDPTGKSELELAEHYRQNADDVENEGY